MQHQLQVGFDLLQPGGQFQRWVDQRQHRAAALLTGTDCHLAPVGHALVGTFVFQAYFAARRDNRCDLRCAKLGGFLDGPVHALAARQALAEVDAQRGFTHPGDGFAQFDAHALLAHFDQLAEVFLAAAVEQLHGVTHCVAQHATDVMGLRLGQVVLAEGERSIDKEAG